MARGGALNIQGYRGKRKDNTSKGPGFLGSLTRPDGGESTELSVEVEVDGREMLIPLLVPGLKESEVSQLLSGQEPTKKVLDRAVEYALGREREGLSPFKPGPFGSRRSASEGERSRMGEFLRTQFDRFIGEPLAALESTSELPFQKGEVTELTSPVGKLFRTQEEGAPGPTIGQILEATAMGIVGGMPGGGTGPANILRKDALKRLRIFKKIDSDVRALSSDAPSSFWNNMKSAIRALPQKELDRVEEIGYSRYLSNPRTLGEYNRITGVVEIRTANVADPTDTLFHEVIHARQLPSIPYLEKKGSLKKVPSERELRVSRGSEGLGEELIDSISTFGSSAADEISQGAYGRPTRFYWNDPQEKLARIAGKMLERQEYELHGVKPGKSIPDKVYDQIYRKALTVTLEQVKREAPKLFKIKLRQAKAVLGKE